MFGRFQLFYKKMFPNVPVTIKKISEYKEVVGEKSIESLRQSTAHMKGLKVLNISSTAFGGGVSELLYTTVPLMIDLGIDAGWQVIQGDDAFFTVTKNIHNGLQGMDFLLTEHMKKIYEDQNRTNAELFESDADIVIIHDPQPMSMISYLAKEKRDKAKWIWRPHIDLTQPKEEILEYISQFIPYYDAVVMTLPEYAKPEMQIKRFFQVTPTIDPLSPKNSDLSYEAVSEILQRLNIDDSKPIMTQVSRFDPWKDPFGVIDAYRLAKKEIPELQLLMVGSMATDDPEGWHYFEKTARYAGIDPSIRFFSNVTGVGNVEVNAIQRASDVVIQKSKREGFGLVVSEAMWKKKPVVGTKVGGIKLQIKNGENGFLIETTEQAAEKIVYLLANQEEERKMGLNAYSFIKENFLTTRELADWIGIFKEVA